MTEAFADIKAQCTDYARCHMLMMSMLVLFFGTLIVPHCWDRIVKSGFIRKEGVVVESLSHEPNVSYVTIQYKQGDKTYKWVDTFRQDVKTGDHVVLYVDEKNNKVIFESPSCAYYIIILVLYVIILLVCAMLVWRFF